MDQVTVLIEVDVNPTESEEKIRKGVFSLFGDLPMQLKPAAKGGVLTAESKGEETLCTLRNVLRRDHIRDAARRAILKSLRGETFVFYLNKQVAFVGKASFCEAESESPLGSIKVTVHSDDPIALIDWLAPRTAKS